MGEKKKFKWYKPFVVLFVIALVLSAPIVTLYICFYDGTAKQVQEDTSFNKDTFLKDRVLESLDNTKDTGQIDIKVTESDFNQLLLTATNSVTNTFPAVKNFLNGADLKTGDDDYVFSINAHVTKAFKTRLRVYTTLKSEEINGEDSLVFTVKDIKLGRISFLKTFKKNKFIRRFLNDELINSLLDGTGFSLKSDIDQNSRIYYPKESIVNDISLFTSGLVGSSGLYSSLMQEYFHQGMFKVDFKKDGFTGGVNLVPAHTNDEFVSDEKKNTVDWEQLKDNVKFILDNSDLDPSYANVLYKYFIVGYAKLNEEEKDVVNGFDLSVMGIDDVTTHKGVIIDFDVAGSETLPGYIVRPEVSIQDNLSSQVNLSPCDPGDTICILDENELNKTLSSSDSIGTPYVFANKNSDGNYKVTTFTVNNIYTNIYDDSVKFAVCLSVNGYDTYICMDTTLHSGADLVMRFDINHVYYGENAASEAFEFEILNLLFQSFESDAIVSIDKDNKCLLVNIASSLNNEKKDKIEAAGGTDQIVEGETKDDNGRLIFKVKNS